MLQTVRRIFSQPSHETSLYWLTKTWSGSSEAALDSLPSDLCDVYEMSWELGRIWTLPACFGKDDPSFRPPPGEGVGGFPSMTACDWLNLAIGIKSWRIDAYRRGIFTSCHWVLALAEIVRSVWNRWPIGEGFDSIATKRKIRYVSVPFGNAVVVLWYSVSDTAARRLRVRS